MASTIKVDQIQSDSGNVSLTGNLSVGQVLTGNLSTSQISIPSPSGTGIVTISSPSTNTDRALTLPDADGTVYNQGNILGTVSESSGVPTGAIIESGSNANGQFVKYADGTMICTSASISAGAPSTASGNIFINSSNITWTYPAVFASTAIARSGLETSGVGLCWIVRGSSGGEDETGMSFRVARAPSSASIASVRLMAIGRWF